MLKKYLHIPYLKFLFGAAVFASSLTFQSCDQAEDAVQPTNMVEASGSSSVVAGKYIVVLKKGKVLRLAESASYQDRLRKVKNYGQQILQERGIKPEVIETTYGSALEGFVAELSESEAGKLRRDSRVDYIEQDRIITLARPGGGGTTPTGQTVPYGIKRVGYASGAGKTAWVIDTGIDLDHPDLKVDVARSKTFITTGLDANSADDGNGHGTHVAGTIAAKNNTIGVIGVAYDATVVAVKVLNSQGSGSYSGVIAGVDYVANTASSGDVANMSLGGPVSQALDDAILSAAGKGIKFAIAAGNDGANAANYSPARVNHNNVYTISAMNSSNVWASFSNWGTPVDFCAPGVSIQSTWKGGTYNTISGTSMAAPHAAGVLLLRSTPASDGNVINDPDGKPDPIVHI